MNNSGSRLRGQLLGSFALTLDGALLTTPGRKVLALVAYLAARSEPVSRTELVEYLWDDGQLLYLRQLLPKARAWLGEPGALAVTPTEVSLELTTDAADFRLLIDREDYAAALELWPVLRRGDHQKTLLAGLVPPTRQFGDWLAQERSYFEALRQEALLALGLQLERTGEWTRALASYQDLLTLDQLAEEAQRGLMRVALRTGQIHLGLQQYEKFLQKLRREFDGPVEPLPETVQLAAELRLAAEHETVARAGIRLSKLTSIGATFTGRQKELRHLRSLLDDASGRVLTVTAPGGAGKTAIAVQAALHWQQDDDGRVVFLELEHLPAGQSLTAAVAAELGIRLTQDGDPLDAVSAILSREVILLVLDGAEARPDAVSDIAQLGSASINSSRLLVTSRVSLDLYNELAWRLPGMSYPQQAEKVALAEFDAIRLFCHAARRSQPDFDPDTESLQLIGSICAAVDGLPLAVVLAASLSRKLSLAGILRSVQDDPLTLQADLPDVPDRHRRLHSVVATTWVNMAREDRETLHKLSVFKGGFDTAAARSVADAGLHRLLRFVNRSLVSVRSPDRFDLHPLLRAWALDSLEAGGNLGQATRLHTDHYLDLAGTLYERVRQARVPEYLEATNAELSNFMASLDNLEAETRWDAGVRLCMQLVPLWDLTGRRAQAIGAAERFLGSASDTLEKGRLLSGLASINRRLGYLAEAQNYSESAAVLFSELDEKVALAMEYGNQAVIARSRSQFPRAAQLYDRALRVIRDSGHEHELTILLNNYGVLLQTTGQLHQALQVHRECLALREQRSDVRGIIDSLINIGNVLSELGQGEQAVEIRLSLLAMPELQAPDDVTARHIRLLLAYDYLLMKRYGAAEALLPNLLGEAAASGDRMIESYALSYQAQCAAHTGREPLAAARYKQAAAAFIALDNQLELARVIQALGIIAGRNGNWPYFHRAARLAEQQLQALAVGSEETVSESLAALHAVAPPAAEPVVSDTESELGWLLENDPIGDAGLDLITVE